MPHDMLQYSSVTAPFELDRMVKLDVIKPVTEPTDFVSSITYAMNADGSLRVCLDPKDLNRALK